MHISRIYIDGFKRLTKFELELNPAFNIIVGDNETGKSSVLEALGLVLTGQYDGRQLRFALDPYLFNAGKVAEYFTKLRGNGNAPSPEILIEAYFNDDPENPALGRMKGTNNSKGENCPGLELKIQVEHDHVAGLTAYARDASNPAVLPVEFYGMTWRSFASNGVTSRDLPCKAKIIDTSLVRSHRGPNRYIAQLAQDILSPEQRRNLSIAFRGLHHKFSKEPEVAAINAHLESKGNPATKKKLTVQMDMSSQSAWDSAVSAHLDDLPFDCAGKGEQCRIQMRLAIADADACQIFLIEEPENHLSHSNLSAFLDDISKDCAQRQVIVTTHSAFVLNKLGIDNLRLISSKGVILAFDGLSADTKDYFMKLPGFNTLRLILSRRCILVEGPSDELIVQRAYNDSHGHLPLEDGVDVISVGSLAFKRFLEIAALLKLDVRVVTDNDGDVAALKSKYADYLDGRAPTIRICFDEDENYSTLEPELLKANGRDALNAILGTNHKDDPMLLKYMENNKTECALRIFQSTTQCAIPGYIADAIK
jgi:putative ATP-dependent endonuclease of the OLD family